MNFFAVISLFLVLTVSSTHARYPFAQIAQRYEQEVPVEQTVYSSVPQSYNFAYTTGGLQGVSDVAQHFREESRDNSGYVVGKYGYVDPYGKLRVVNYRAGADGYTATGDIGPDEEGVRQQREQLYGGDRSYQIQQQVWRAISAGQPIEGILASAATGSSASSASAASASSASSSSSSSSSSNSAPSETEWAAVHDGHSAGYTAATKGGRQVFAERYTAAAVKSPIAHLRETSTTSVNSQKSSSSSASSSAASSASSSSAYTAHQPAVSQTVYSTKSVPVSTVVQTSRYVQPAVTQTVYTTKTAPVQTAAIKSYGYTIPSHTIHSVVKPARLVESSKTVYQNSAYTTGFQSPAARLVAINGNSASSSSASASAAASASASSSSTSGAYTVGGVKGYSGAIKSAPRWVSPAKVARYAIAPTGGRTVVNFSQGGPVPYRYNYSFK